jgi:HK97 family phage major capsid protein
MKQYWSATTVLVSPDVWAKLLVFRPGTDNTYALPAGMIVSVTGMVQVTNGTGMINVVPVSFLTGGQILLGDFSEAAMIESEGLTLRQSDSHSDYFVKNLIVFLLERVEALAVFRPDAFIAAELSLS